ncbi:acetylornithine deacetylase [Rhodospirillum sp. A1_3_36]|uniref:acetylornithine deacetylase n=1 Tax=Rhodospirillum sp. A1_3_36 TaxID=3391666 RepID=UPI0039A71265
MNAPMNVRDILSRLVGFPSVVGTPNREIVDWIASYLDDLGACVHVLDGPEGDRANLFATLGPTDQRGYVLSGHMDVVPATEGGWLTNPYTLTRQDDRLHGRGTSDMKGFIACALSIAAEVAAGVAAGVARRPLLRPLHFAFSYDEEAGCQGAPHMIARLPELCRTPRGCIIGEPSSLRAVRAHKGKAAALVEIIGKAGHSSRPDLGLNAIHAMTKVLTTATHCARHLTQGPLAEQFEPPYSTLQVGTIRGGRAVNIIPDHCSAELEARAIAGVDPASLLTEVRDAVQALSQEGFETEWRMLSTYPALALGADAPLARLMAELTGEEPLAAVSYGSEGGLFQAAGLDAIICGPGDIARAHKINEFITDGELAACETMLRTLADRLAQPLSSAPLSSGEATQ